jgi:beta-glucanase (GH16 family)
MASIRALLGLFPKTIEYENKRISLEEEYNSLVAFKASKELMKYHELEAYVISEEFARKKREILDLRFKATEDYLKEKEFFALKKKKDIKTYYEIKDSEELTSYNTIEKSNELKNFRTLEKFVNSEEFALAKKEAFRSSKEKFLASDLAKTLHQYEQQKQSDEIKGYFKFIGSRYYKDFLSIQESGLNITIVELEKEVQSKAFIEKKIALKKAEFRNSPEKAKLDALRKLKKSKVYRNYLKLTNSSAIKYYNSLHNSSELEVFEDLKNFVNSDNFKRQRKEIESKTFKDTNEYKKLLEYLELKKSVQLKFYFKFSSSKEYKIYTDLKGSDRIKEFEILKANVESDEFQKFKAYCLKQPKKRWLESKEFETFQEYEALKESEKIVWYFKNINSKKFAWHRSWVQTFIEDFSASKLDAKKWITRYYWGDKILKGGYSLSYDKHLVTDGQNLHFENGKLNIITKKEVVHGKSWHATKGFITREFGYTSGLINTGSSFKQMYGTFEAKIKIHEAKALQNAFWLVGMTQVPHIDIVKAGKRVFFGNMWGNSRDLKSLKKYSTSLRRDRLAKDFFIYTVEWLPGKIVWKINGVEVAKSQQGVPVEPMYMVISSGLQKELNGILPARLEVDWVRCFQHTTFTEGTKP